MQDVKVFRGAAFVMLALVSVLTVGGLSRAEPASEDKKKAAEKESPKLYTNQDLPQERQATGRTYTNKDLPPEQPAGAPAGKPEKTYTNQDLPPAPVEPPAEAPVEAPAPAPAPEAAGEPAPAAPAEPPAAAEGDPQALLEAELRTHELNARLVSQTQRALVAARERLENLEVQLLAVSNPFSARPKLSTEEEELRATTTETAAQRKARTEEMVKQARLEVMTLEDRLAELRR